VCILFVSADDKTIVITNTLIMDNVKTAKFNHVLLW